MKKLFVTSALALSISMGLYSCNNGAYDADPTTDLSAGQNPLNPTSGTGVLIGTMKAYINGQEVVFSPVYHVTDTFNTRRLYARVPNDSIYNRSILITYAENSYVGPSIDTIGKKPLLSFEYKVYDPDNKYYNIYTASQGNGNMIEVNVKGAEGGHMRGSITGTLNKTMPLAAPASQVTFSETEFYSKKEAFPLK